MKHKILVLASLVLGCLAVILFSPPLRSAASKPASVAASRGNDENGNGISESVIGRGFQIAGAAQPEPSEPRPGWFGQLYCQRTGWL